MFAKAEYRWNLVRTIWTQHVFPSVHWLGTDLQVGFIAGVGLVCVGLALLAPAPSDDEDKRPESPSRGEVVAMHHRARGGSFPSHFCYIFRSQTSRRTTRPMAKSPSWKKWGTIFRSSVALLRRSDANPYSDNRPAGMSVCRACSTHSPDCGRRFCGGGNDGRGHHGRPRCCHRKSDSCCQLKPHRGRASASLQPRCGGG